MLQITRRVELGDIARSRRLPSGFYPIVVDSQIACGRPAKEAPILPAKPRLRNSSSDDAALTRPAAVALNPFARRAS